MDSATEIFLKLLFLLSVHNWHTAVAGNKLLDDCLEFPLSFMHLLADFITLTWWLSKFKLF